MSPQTSVALQVGPGVAPARQVKQLMQGVYAEFGELFRDVAAAGAEQGITLVCKPGCAACCTYLAHSFRADALAATDAVQALPASVRQGVVDRLYAWAAAWVPFSRSRNDLTGDRETTRVAWGAKLVACPMLDPQHQTCLVYESRPIVCRTMHAAVRNREDPPACPSCPDEDAPYACVTREQHVQCGHEPYVWQLRDDLTLQADVLAIQRFAQYGVGTDWLDQGALPIQVLERGQERYGWRPKTVVPLPMWSESDG